MRFEVNVESSAGGASGQIRFSRLHPHVMGSGDNYQQCANISFALFLRFIFACRKPVSNPQHRFQRKSGVVRAPLAYLVLSHGFEKTYKQIKINVLYASHHVHRTQS